MCGKDPWITKSLWIWRRRQKKEPLKGMKACSLVSISACLKLRSSQFFPCSCEYAAHIASLMHACMYAWIDQQRSSSKKQLQLQLSQRPSTIPRITLMQLYLQIMHAIICPRLMQRDCFIHTFTYHSISPWLVRTQNICVCNQEVICCKCLFRLIYKGCIGFISAAIVIVWLIFSYLRPDRMQCRFRNRTVMLLHMRRCPRTPFRFS